MNLVLDPQVVIAATSAVVGLATGFFTGWVARGRAEKPFRAELARLEVRLLNAIAKRNVPEPGDLLDDAKTMMRPRQPRVAAGPSSTPRVAAQRSDTRSMSLAQVNEYAQRARDEEG